MIKIVLNILIELKVPTHLIGLPSSKLIHKLERDHLWTFNQLRAIECLCSITNVQDARLLLEAANSYLTQEYTERYSKLDWLPDRLRHIVMRRNKRTMAISWGIEAVQDAINKLPVLATSINKIDIHDEFNLLWLNFQC
jgi:hypothetical protein